MDLLGVDNYYSSLEDSLTLPNKAKNCWEILKRKNTHKYLLHGHYFLMRRLGGTFSQGRDRERQNLNNKSNVVKNSKKLASMFLKKGVCEIFRV